MRSWSTRAGSCVTTGDGPAVLGAAGGGAAGGAPGREAVLDLRATGVLSRHSAIPQPFFYNGILFTKRICRWLQMSRVHGNVNLTPPFLRPEGADL